MSKSSEVIKSVAIVLAIALAAAIIGGIISACFALVSFFDGSSPKKLDEPKVYRVNGDIKNLDIEVGASNVTIKRGEVFEVVTDNADIMTKENGDKLSVIENTPNKLKFNNKDFTDLTITVPSTTFNDVKMELGAGQFSISDLKMDNLKLTLGAGVSTLDQVLVNKESKIETGAGQLNVNDSRFSNLKLELGMGEVNFEASVVGDSKIEAGVGELNLRLLDKEETYAIDVEKGLGEIKYNGKSVSNGEVVGNGYNTIKISGGIGEININTK